MAKPSDASEVQPSSPLISNPESAQGTGDTSVISTSAGAPSPSSTEPTSGLPSNDSGWSTVTDLLKVKGWLPEGWAFDKKGNKLM